jgi:hypothetical protein
MREVVSLDIITSDIRNKSVTQIALTICVLMKWNSGLRQLIDSNKYFIPKSI